PLPARLPHVAPGRARGRRAVRTLRRRRAGAVRLLWQARRDDGDGAGTLLPCLRGGRGDVTMYEAEVEKLRKELEETRAMLVRIAVHSVPGVTEWQLRLVAEYCREQGDLATAA